MTLPDYTMSAAEIVQAIITESYDFILPAIGVTGAFLVVRAGVAWLYSGR